MAYGQFAQYYDRLMEEIPYSKWLAFAEACWERYGRPVQVAELGCGTGAVTIPFARSGLKVYGIDLSGEMLSIARDKYDSARLSEGGATGEDIVWLEQDMREWELPGPVDAVVSFCDSLNYITEEEDVAAVFRQTYAGLRPGGLFVFDVHTPRTLREYADNHPYVWDEDDLAYIWTCSFDEERVEIEHDLTFFVREQGKESFTRFRENHVQRAYPLEWLKGELAKAGFAEVRALGDFTWEEADGETVRAFFIAKKP